MAELILDNSLTGVELRRVHHLEQKRDLSIDLTEVPAGRKLLARAAAAGFPHPGWSFWVWLKRPEQQSLFESATDQYWAVTRPGRNPRQATAPQWYQLIVRSKQVRTVLPTRFGIGPFEDDEAGKYSDWRSHVAGLNVLSEAYVAHEDWEGSVYAESQEKIGSSRGLLRPAPLLFVSPRVREILTRHRVHAGTFEVAHLVRGGVPTITRHVVA